MNRINIFIAIIVLISPLFAQWIFTSADGEFRSALAGGELLVGANIRYEPLFNLTPRLRTYQSRIGWQTWNLEVRTSTKIYPEYSWKLIATLGIQADMVNLSDRIVSPSLQGCDKISRYRPTFALGAGLDSIEFLGEDNGYLFTGEFLIGDFLPLSYRFSDASTDGETLSTTMWIYAEMATPYGAGGVFRKATSRGWFGDNIWQISYFTPYITGNFARAIVGWESGYFGFGAVELNLYSFAETLPLSISLGAKIPKEASLWQWSMGLTFYPYVDSNKKQDKSKNVEILAPITVTPY